MRDGYPKDFIITHPQYKVEYNFITRVMCLYLLNIELCKIGKNVWRYQSEE